MAKSHKPVVWFPFAAGGTVIAFCMPVIVLLTFLADLFQDRVEPLGVQSRDIGTLRIGGLTGLQPPGQFVQPIGQVISCRKFPVRS